MKTVAWLCLAFCVSCAHAPVTEPSGVATQAPPPGKEPWYGDLRALARRAADVRGLTLTVAFDIVPLADDELFASYAGLQRDSASALAKELRATFEALNLSGGPIPSLDGLTQGTADEVRSEQLVAFYHFKTHRLVVRRALPPALEKAGAELTRVVLAHEVGHVLQDQLGYGNVEPGSFDAALAHKAVLEGDANLTATLVEGARKGLTAQRAVERARVTLTAMTGNQLIELGGFSPKLLSAPPLLRELFIFPYVRGQRFVTDVYAAGGLALVDEMMKHPPLTTDAIYHPQRWLDGGGHRAGELGPNSRRLGAMLLRALLEGCNRSAPTTPAEVLEWTERHFVDDSLARTGDSLAWLTTWDDAEPLAPSSVGAHPQSGNPANWRTLNMQLAEQVMTTVARCMGAKDPELKTEARGDALGLSVRAPGEAKRLAKLPPPTPAAPPLGRQVIPQAKLELAFRSAGEGEVRGAVWTHRRLGLTMDWPEGSRLVNNPAASLTAMLPGAMIFGSFVDDAGSATNTDGFLNAALSAFFKAAHVGPQDFSMGTKHDWTEVERDGVRVTELRERFEPSISVRARVTPLCDGKAGFYVVAVALTASTEPAIERWMDSLHSAKSAPVCSEE